MSRRLPEWRRRRANRIAFAILAILAFAGLVFLVAVALEAF